MGLIERLTTAAGPVRPRSLTAVAGLPLTVAVFLLAGFAGSSFTRFLLSLAAAGALIAVGLVPLLGQARIVSLASGAFVAVGAYGSGLLVDGVGVPYAVAVLASAVLAGAMGLLLGLPSVRFRGHYLTLVTLVFQVTVIIGIREWASVTGGARGVRYPRITAGFGMDTETTVYVSVFVALALVALVIGLLASGDLGKAMIAVASAEIAAETFDIRPERFRILAFGISASIAGLAGGFLGPLLRFFDPASFDLFQSVLHLSYAVIGGVTLVAGAMVGAGVLVLLPEFLRPVAEYQEVLYALLLLVIVLVIPDGLVGRAVRLLRDVTSRRRSQQPPARPRVQPQPLERGPSRALQPSGGSTDDARTVVVCRRVSRSFDGLQAVRSVDLEVKAGRIRAVIGPNGAGKTTLLNVISGVDPPDGGEVVLAGRDVTTWRPAERATLGLTRTFQNLQLFPALSALDNVRLGSLEFTPGPAAWRSITLTRDTDPTTLRALAVLDELEFDADPVRPVGTLALGQQRRVEIARALISRPQVLLLDEPVAGLTVDERTSLTALIRRIVEQTEVGVVFVEHDMEFVVDVADRVTAMVEGAIVADGDADTVLANPAVQRAYFGETRT